MVGTFSLLVCLLLATGRLCHATLSKATSSITPKIAVGANAVISIDVTTSIQATDVRVSLNGIQFKTVEIRPSSITIPGSGADSSDTRVKVTYEVLTANTNVRVKVLFTPIQKEDKVIKFEDTADVDEKSFTLDVQYCDIAFLQPTATSVNSSITCGSGCVKQFTCNSTFKLETFTAKCQDTATWNVSTAPCSKACDNSFFTKAVAVDGSIVGNGESKNFNCNCSKPVASFTRTCGPDGQWSNQTDPCSSVTCIADNIKCASSESNGPLCGGDTHIFSYTDTNNLKINSTFECGANGTWLSTECDNNTVIDRNVADSALGATYVLLFFLFFCCYCPMPDDSTICGYNVKKAVLLPFLVAFVMVVSGVIMVAFGSDEVAIAGIVLASVGNGALLIAVVICCVIDNPIKKGKKDKQNVETVASDLEMTTE